MSEAASPNGRTRKFLSELLRPLEHPVASQEVSGDSRAWVSGLPELTAETETNGSPEPLLATDRSPRIGTESDSREFSRTRGTPKKRQSAPPSNTLPDDRFEILNQVVAAFQRPDDLVVCGFAPSPHMEGIGETTALSFSVDNQSSMPQFDYEQRRAHPVFIDSRNPTQVLRGLLDVRERLRQDRRIIALFESDDLAQLLPEMLGLSTGSPHNLLLIGISRAPGEMKGDGASVAGAGSGLLATRFANANWRVSLLTAAGLRTEGEFRWEQCCTPDVSSLLLIESPGNRTTESIIAKELSSPATPSPAFLNILVQHCLVDPEFILVATNELLNSNRISAPYHEGVYSFARNEVEEILDWCQGVGTAGGEPVVVLTTLEALPFSRRITQILQSAQSRCRFVIVAPDAIGQTVSVAPGVNLTDVTEQLMNEFSAISNKADSRSVAYATADGLGLFPVENSLTPPGVRRHMARVTFIEEQSTGFVTAGLRASWSGMTAKTSESEAIDQQVRSMQFPPALQEWIDRCDAVESRSDYLWRWCLFAVDLLTLPTVPKSRREDVLRIKVLLAMYNVLLDDLADLGDDPGLLEELLHLGSYAQRPRVIAGRIGIADRGSAVVRLDPLDPVSERSSNTSVKSAAYRSLCYDVWEEFNRTVSRLPYFHQLRSVFQFDVTQLMTTIDYSQMLNVNPYLLNRADHDRFSPFGMMVMCAATIDLMASDGVDPNEYGAIREVVAEGEWMARIGNLVSTWRRELPSGDVTSGIFAESVATGVISISELIDPTLCDRNVELIELAGIEQRYIRKWRHHRSQLQRLARTVSCCDLASYADAFDKLWMSEIASIGQK